MKNKKKPNLKYGTSSIQRNWNRISELTNIRLRRRLSEKEKAELRYRIAIQNNFGDDGIPEDFIEP